MKKVVYPVSNETRFIEMRPMDKINVEELKQYFFGGLSLPVQVQEKPIAAASVQK